MNTEQERADFEAWAASIGFCVTGRYAETIAVLCAESAFKAGYKAARAAPQPAEQQPAEGEEIMVNTPYDVFTLPLRPSGLGGKGPRFVVHVPGPRQHAAPDVEALVEALEVIQKVATPKSIRTGIRAATALGCISAICDITFAAHRKQGVKQDNQ